MVIDFVAHPDETTALIAKVDAAGGHAVGVKAIANVRQPGKVL